MAYITVLIRIRELWAALPVSMSDKHAEWFLVGLNSKFLVSPVALFQLFSLKCISRNDRVTNQNAKPVAVAAVEDCRSDWVVSTVEVTELKPETEKAVVGLFRWKCAVWSQRQLMQQLLKWQWSRARIGIACLLR